MIKKTITYTGYDDVERTEDFYFHMTETELANTFLYSEGDFIDKIRSIINAKDVPALARYFRDLIEMSYGVRTPDGRGFKKSKEAFEDFKATPAYDILFMSLARDDNAAAEFINGIIPKSIKDRMDASDDATPEKLGIVMPKE